MALRLTQYGALFVCGLISSRELGAEGRAAYALPLALGSTVWLLSHFSLDAALGRHFARQEADLRALVRIRASGVLLIGTAGGLVAFALGIAFPGRLVGHADLTAVALGAATVPLWLAVSASGGVLLITGETAAYGCAGAGSAILQLGLLWALLATTGLTPELALLTVVVGLGVNALAFAAVLARALGARSLLPSSDWSLFRRLIRVGLLLHPAAIALALSLQIDLFCVAALGSSEQVGFYSVAAMLASSVFLAVSSLAQAGLHMQMQPDEDAAAAYTARFVKRSALAASILAAAGVAAGYPLIRLVYGPEWTSSVLPFMILTIAAVPLMIQAPATAFLARSARPRIFAVAGICLVATNLCLNLLMIPPLGILGSALASLVTYCLYAAALLLVFQKVTGQQLRSRYSVG